MIVSWDKNNTFQHKRSSWHENQVKKSEYSTQLKKFILHFLKF